MTNLLETFASQLQITAEREDAIKACRVAQVRAYVAQKAANVPQDQRCKAPVISKQASLKDVRALTASYEQIIAHPRVTSSRRDALVRRVAALTGITPGPAVSVQEMLETIEDYEGPRAAAQARHAADYEFARPSATDSRPSTTDAERAIRRGIAERRLAALAVKLGDRAPLSAARPDLLPDGMLSTVMEEIERRSWYYRRAA